MVEPITTALILGAISAIATYVIFYFVNLTLEIVANWFRKFAYLMQGIDRNYVAFTLQDRLRTGQYKTVQGIFNQSSNSIYDIRGVKSETVDWQVNSAHENGREPLVVWN